jgi:hypothetical protein
MACGYCGAEIADPSSTFCARCGRLLEISQPVVQAAYAGALESLHGVAGWLLLLCIVLTIGIPLLTAYNWSKVIGIGIASFQWFSLLISIVMATFSFIAGLLLWRVHPRAVPVAKAYFVAEMALPIIFGARLLIEMASTRIQMSPWTILAAFVRPILMAMVGYLYLVKSKRVRATYSRASAAAA